MLRICCTTYRSPDQGGTVTPGRGPKTKTFGAALGVPGVKVKTAWFTHITVRGSHILL